LFICFYVTIDRLPKDLNHFETYHMEDTLKRITTMSITISILSLTAVFLYIGNNDINKPAIAQLTTQNPFPNNTETIESLDKLLGNNTAIILSDSHISNPKNTVLDSININIKEDCMKLPNSEHMYCP
jgi:lysophospholipase L1-like esterase